ncbi:MAG: sigma-70 family RNA polymerase sigma factor [Firmicutes bacterium]|nr:sigma-70 family RNA polymerase sigma factor [Bacillota bacterium]
MENRSRREAAGVEAAAAAAAGRSGPEEAALRREEIGLIRNALEALPVRDRACLLLRFSGMSYAEIAEVLGVAEGTVKSRMFFARKELLEKLR